MGLLFERARESTGWRVGSLSTPWDRWDTRVLIHVFQWKESRLCLSPRRRSCTTMVGVVPALRGKLFRRYIESTIGWSNILITRREDKWLNLECCCCQFNWSAMSNNPIRLHYSYKFPSYKRLKMAF